MPLVVMCGFPSSGKSTRAKELVQYLQDTHGTQSLVIGDAQQGIDRSSVYSDSKEEKELRGNLKSAVQRQLNKDCVVILDSPNYIKGYRYELFCVCKSARTTLCVIQCDIEAETAREFNSLRPEAERYADPVLDGLIMRFEAPNPQNRWDSPLFIVRPGESLKCQDIYDALFMKKAAAPNLSTQSQPLSASNYLHELDKITQTVVTQIMDAQKSCVPGDYITVSGAEQKIEFCKTLSLAELQRYRRQFITFTKSQVISDVSKIANMFVVFLNKSLH